MERKSCKSIGLYPTGVGDIRSGKCVVCTQQGKLEIWIHPKQAVNQSSVLTKTRNNITHDFTQID